MSKMVDVAGGPLLFSIAAGHHRLIEDRGHKDCEEATVEHRDHVEATAERKDHVEATVERKDHVEAIVSTKTM